MNGKPSVPVGDARAELMSVVTKRMARSIAKPRTPFSSVVVSMQQGMTMLAEWISSAILRRYQSRYLAELDGGEGYVHSAVGAWWVIWMISLWITSSAERQGNGSYRK